MIKKIFYKGMTDGFEPTVGYSVYIDGWLPAFVHKVRRWWRVSEVRTGRIIEVGKTRAEAIANADKRIALSLKGSTKLQWWAHIEQECDATGRAPEPEDIRR